MTLEIHTVFSESTYRPYLFILAFCQEILEIYPVFSGGDTGDTRYAPSIFGVCILAIPGHPSILPGHTSEI